jgi:hypothetical protein
MSTRRAKLLFLCKLVIAAAAIVAIVAIPARQLAPSMALDAFVLYCAAGVACIIALVVVAALCSLQFSQFILRAGGTDAQWFWFPGEPKGLVALRGERSEGEGARDVS